MSEQGRKASWESSSLTTTATPKIATRLRIRPGDQVMCTQYECTADRQPVQLATSWEPLAITEGTDILFPERGPYAGLGVRNRMAAVGITGLTARELVGARPASSDEAEALGCPPSSAVLSIERTYVDIGGRPVETADLVIRADRWRLAYEA
jgi:GntR family transcriptional regulator